ncbi:hypothetical protein OROHE_005058 [Orobanche hederae]
MGNFPANLGLIRVYPFLSYHVVLVNCRLSLRGQQLPVLYVGRVVLLGAINDHPMSGREWRERSHGSLRLGITITKVGTKHLVCIMLGDSVTAGVLLHFVEQQVKSRLSAPDLVRKTDQIAKQYIEINPNEEVSYIAGYDKEHSTKF